MNTNIHSDRKLAEALMSLSIEPVAFKAAARPTWYKRFGIPVAVLVACGAGAALIWPGPDPEADLLRQTVQGTAGQVQAAPAPQTAAPLAPLPVGREVTGSGYVVAPEQTAVFARYAGDVVAVEVALGDRVQKGQVLVRLQDPEAQFALDNARITRRTAELALAAARLGETMAETTLQRDEKLFAKGALPGQQLLDSRNAHDMAKNAVAQAEAAIGAADVGLGQAQSVVDHLTVRAPIGGIVTAITARVGNSILSRVDSTRGEGDLLTITDTDRMVIEADVAETNIGHLRAGLKGEAVLDGFPDAPFPIEVERIAPTIAAEKGTVALRFALIDPPAGIRPNMAASIKLSDLLGPEQGTYKGTQP